MTVLFFTVPGAVTPRTIGSLFALGPTMNPLSRGSWTQNNPNCSGFCLLHIVHPAI